MCDSKNLIALMLVVLVLWLLVNPSVEAFNEQTNEFVPVGYPRYGLRSDPLRMSPISKYYLSPNRQLRINSTSGLMYESNNAPGMEGIGGCDKKDCPSIGYDGMDTCWRCPIPNYNIDVKPYDRS
jgi:hypothetical protein